MTGRVTAAGTADGGAIQESAPQTLRTFATAQDARAYRCENGAGGWIFENDADGSAILFPPATPPIAIFRHPMTRSKSGRLIGSA
jgi:hypothetical protein